METPSSRPSELMCVAAPCAVMNGFTSSSLWHESRINNRSHFSRESLSASQGHRTQLAVRRVQGGSTVPALESCREIKQK